MSTENEGTAVPPAPSAPPVPVESPAASPQATAAGLRCGLLLVGGTPAGACAAGGPVGVGSHGRGRPGGVRGRSFGPCVRLGSVRTRRRVGRRMARVRRLLLLLRAGGARRYGRERGRRGGAPVGSGALLGCRGSGSVHRHGGCGRGRGYRGALVLGAHSFSPRSTAVVLGRTRSRPITCAYPFTRVRGRYVSAVRVLVVCRQLFPPAVRAP